MYGPLNKANTYVGALFDFGIWESNTNRSSRCIDQRVVICRHNYVQL